MSRARRRRMKWRAWAPFGNRGGPADASSMPSPPSAAYSLALPRPGRSSRVEVKVRAIRSSATVVIARRRAANSEASGTPAPSITATALQSSRCRSPGSGLDAATTCSVPRSAQPGIERAKVVQQAPVAVASAIPSRDPESLVSAHGSRGASSHTIAGLRASMPATAPRQTLQSPETIKVTNCAWRTPSASDRAIPLGRCASP